MAEGDVRPDTAGHPRRDRSGLLGQVLTTGLSGVAVAVAAWLADRFWGLLSSAQALTAAVALLFAGLGILLALVVLTIGRSLRGWDLPASIVAGTALAAFALAGVLYLGAPASRGQQGGTAAGTHGTFGGAPAAPSATPTPVAPRSSGAPPPTGELATLPEALVGTWRGTVHIASTNQELAVVLDLQVGDVGTTIGSLSWPSIGCRPNLTLDGATSRSLAATADYYCDANGEVHSAVTKVTAVLRGSSLDWQLYYGTDATHMPSTPVQSATLSKT